MSRLNIIKLFFILIFSACIAIAGAEYYKNPVTAISDFGHPEETMITGDGRILIHWGSVTFLTGIEGDKITSASLTLEKGYYPISVLSFADENFRYKIKTTAIQIGELSDVFYKACTNNLKQEIKVVNIENLINFVHIEAVNIGKKDAPCIINIKPKPSGDMNDSLPMKPDYFSKEYIYYDIKNKKFALSDDGSYFFADTGKKKELLINSNLKMEETASTLIAYDIVPPNGVFSFDLQVPYFPAQISDLKILEQFSYYEAEQRKKAVWDKIFSNTLNFVLPDKKIDEVFKASLVYLTETCVDYVDGQYILRANPFQYDQFYIRDSAFQTRALDMAGMHDLAENCLRHFLECQTPDGRFASQPDQFDANGIALWALGSHIEFTHNKDFALTVVPAVQKSIAWLDSFREKLPDGNPGLLPPSSIHDNEDLKDAHIVGHNLWACAGLKKAACIFETAGYKNEYQDTLKNHFLYKEFLRAQIYQSIEKNNGVLMPSFEGMEAKGNSKGRWGDHGGYDWGNLSSVFPAEIIEPDDKAFDSSIAQWQGLIKDGLFPYPENGDMNLLHHYITFDLTTTALMRGNTGEVSKHLNEGYLGHLSDANAGCERLNAETNDFQPVTNLIPHGTFAARYMELARSLFIRESGNDLIIFSYLPKEWIKQGEKIAVNNAPTVFGKISISLTFSEKQMRLKLYPADSNQKNCLVLFPLPSYLELEKTSEEAQVITYKSIPCLSFPLSRKEINLVYNFRN